MKACRYVPDPYNNIRNYFHTNYLQIDGSCQNSELYETLLKLSALMFQKYGTNRGMVIRAKIKVATAHKLDKDVTFIRKTTEDTEIEVNICLDTGADLGCAQVDFLHSCNFVQLKDQKLSVVTVHGAVKQTYKRFKVQLCRADIGCENIAALAVADIGRENKVRVDFLESIQQHFHFRQEIMDLLGRASGKIHVLIGSDMARLFTNHLACEQIGGRHHAPWMANLAFYKTPFTSKIEFFGKAGINPELFDKDFPTFLVPKSIALECPTRKETAGIKRLGDMAEQYSHIRSLSLIHI